MPTALTAAAVAAVLPTDDFELVLFLETLYLRLLCYADVLDISRRALDRLCSDTSALRRAVLHTYHLNQETDYAGVYVDDLLSGSGGAWAITETEAFEQAANAPVPLLNLGVVNRITWLIAEIKRHPNYTDEVGSDLGLLPDISGEFVYSSGCEGGGSSTATSIGLKR